MTYTDDAFYLRVMFLGKAVRKKDNVEGKSLNKSEAGSSKNLETINAGKGVEKREPSCTVGGNVNWCSHYGEQYGGSLQN